MAATLRPGATFGVGSLPHRSVADAIEFAWSSSDVPTIFTLPRMSPAEGMVAQALVGIEGVSVGQYGGISVDVARLDVEPEIRTDLGSDAYTSFAAFLQSFASRGDGVEWVKWQFIGPVTLGLALVRIGLEPDAAFRLSLQAVRAHVIALEHEVAQWCGDVGQIIVLDEPSLPEALVPGFVLAPDAVVDLVSGGLAAIEPHHVTGVHCCGSTDWGALLSTGANILSVPVPSASDDVAMAETLRAASRISDHLEHGGRIAWGAVRTDGPISVSPERSWKGLVETMCSLVKAGVDPLLLRKMSHVTPACGLGTLSEQLADRVMMHVGDVANRVAEQATASRLTLGS